MISFEAGVEALKRLIGRGGDEAYYANEEDPLHAAFRAKATVHAGPLGLPMMFGAARAKLNSLSSEVRTKEAVAYVQVPFCGTRCLYCMFYQNPLDPTASHRYAELLIKEFGLWASRTVQSRNAGGEISALYFGAARLQHCRRRISKRLLRRRGESSRSRPTAKSRSKAA